MACLAFCANCGSDDLRLGSPASKGVEVSCYTCTAKFVLQNVILGEVDFLAGAKTKVDQMVARAREAAKRTAKGAAR
jgi:hypothetical protein